MKPIVILGSGGQAWLIEGIIEKDMNAQAFWSEY